MNEKNIKIAKREHAFKGYASTYNVEILNYFNPELQLKDYESAIKSRLIELLTQLRGFKFVTTLQRYKISIQKIENKNKTKYDNFCSRSKAEIIVIESDIENVFKSIYTTIIANIQKSLGKGLAWIIDSVIGHTIIISKYDALTGGSCIKLDHSRKGLINIQNIDVNECFKWCLVR